MKINIMKPSEMSDRPPMVYLKNFIPLLQDSVTMIFAEGGVAKSFTSIHMAIKLVEANPNMKAALWLTEDSESENRLRFLKLIDAFGSKDAGYYNDRIVFIESEPYRFTAMKDGNAVLTDDFYEIKEILSKYDFIVLDPLLSFSGIDENSNSQAGVLMGGLKVWAAEHNKIILLLHHATIMDGGKLKSRGARELVNSTRATYSLKKLPFPKASCNKNDIIEFFECRICELVKDNGISAEVIKSYGATKFVLKVLPPMAEL